MNKRESFETRYGRLDDAELVDAIYEKINSHYSNWIDASKLHPLERVIVLVVHVSGIIDNGGFEYLFSGSFEGDSSFQHSMDAHKLACLDRGYEAFREAIDLFAGDIPADPSNRIRQYETKSEVVRMEINSKYWDEGVEGLREKKLAEFIREHSAGFAELDSILS